MYKASCGKKHAPPQGNSSHLLQPPLSTKHPLDVPVPVTGYWESLTDDDAHSSKWNMRGTWNSKCLQAQTLVRNPPHSSSVSTTHGSRLACTSQQSLMQCQAWFGGQDWSGIIPSQPSGGRHCFRGRARELDHVFASHKWHLAPGPQDCALIHVVTYVKPLQTTIPNSMCLKPCWMNPFWITQNKTKKLWSLLARHCECLKHCLFLLFMPAVITSNPTLLIFSGFVITPAEERKKDGENSALRRNTKAATATTAWTV